MRTYHALGGRSRNPVVLHAFEICRPNTDPLIYSTRCCSTTLTSESAAEALIRTIVKPKTYYKPKDYTLLADCLLV